MTDRDDRGDLLLRTVLIASAVLAVGAFIVAVDRMPRRPAAPRDDAPMTATVMPEDDAIAYEAAVFRTNAGTVALDPTDQRHRGAHPRNLRTYRLLRAFPGAPPRIPHGFTSDEFRSGACRTCHERGGFSPRFGAYVPVTPHPEMGACLQCHVGNDAVTGVTLPNADPSARCLQCHVKASPRLRDVRSADEQQVTWPSLAPKGADRLPPPIPHPSQWRFNCVACHSGPSAVAEIRTDHPERANCRSCHVAPLGDVPPYVRAERVVPRAGAAQ